MWIIDILNNNNLVNKSSKWKHFCRVSLLCSSFLLHTTLFRLINYPVIQLIDISHLLAKTCRCIKPSCWNGGKDGFITSLKWSESKKLRTWVQFLPGGTRLKAPPVSLVRRSETPAHRLEPDQEKNSGTGNVLLGADTESVYCYWGKSIVFF